MIRFPRPRARRPGLARLLDDERFVRGLGLGALIGAAIAGSTLWSRLRRDTAPEIGTPVEISPPPPAT